MGYFDHQLELIQPRLLRPEGTYLYACNHCFQRNRAESYAWIPPPMDVSA